ncbi:hypothetical protein C8R45DRAFT_1028440 [Mycena sanguinolenta]|nr:hypothetical protein C8R45DRAFT_1028440 [Mycena sanguinolenta]
MHRERLQLLHPLPPPLSFIRQRRTDTGRTGRAGWGAKRKEEEAVPVVGPIITLKRLEWMGRGVKQRRDPRRGRRARPRGGSTLDGFRFDFDFSCGTRCCDRRPSFRCQRRPSSFPGATLCALPNSLAVFSNEADGLAEEGRDGSGKRRRGCAIAERRAGDAERRHRSSPISFCALGHVTYESVLSLPEAGADPNLIRSTSPSYIHREVQATRPCLRYESTLNFKFPPPRPPVSRKTRVPFCSTCQFLRPSPTFVRSTSRPQIGKMSIPPRSHPCKSRAKSISIKILLTWVMILLAGSFAICRQ